MEVLQGGVIQAVYTLMRKKRISLDVGEQKTWTEEKQKEQKENYDYLANVGKDMSTEQKESVVSNMPPDLQELFFQTDHPAYIQFPPDGKRNDNITSEQKIEYERKSNAHRKQKFNSPQVKNEYLFPRIRIKAANSVTPQPSKSSIVKKRVVGEKLQQIRRQDAQAKERKKEKEEQKAKQEQEEKERKRGEARAALEAQRREDEQKQNEYVQKVLEENGSTISKQILGLKVQAEQSWRWERWQSEGFSYFDLWKKEYLGKFHVGIWDKSMYRANPPGTDLGEEAVEVLEEDEDKQAKHLLKTEWKLLLNSAPEINGKYSFKVASRDIVEMEGMDSKEKQEFRARMLIRRANQNKKELYVQNMNLYHDVQETVSPIPQTSEEDEASTGKRTYGRDQNKIKDKSRIERIDKKLGELLPYGVCWRRQWYGRWWCLNTIREYKWWLDCIKLVPWKNHEHVVYKKVPALLETRKSCEKALAKLDKIRHKFSGEAQDQGDTGRSSRSPWYYYHLMFKGYLISVQKRLVEKRRLVIDVLDRKTDFECPYSRAWWVARDPDMVAERVALRNAAADYKDAVLWFTGTLPSSLIDHQFEELDTDKREEGVREIKEKRNERNKQLRIRFGVGNVSFMHMMIAVVPYMFRASDSQKWNVTDPSTAQQAISDLEQFWERGYKQYNDAKKLFDAAKQKLDKEGKFQSVLTTLDKDWSYYLMQLLWAMRGAATVYPGLGEVELFEPANFVTKSTLFVRDKESQDSNIVLIQERINQRKGSRTAPIPNQLPKKRRKDTFWDKIIDERPPRQWFFLPVTQYKAFYGGGGDFKHLWLVVVLREAYISRFGKPLAHTHGVNPYTGERNVLEGGAEYYGYLDIFRGVSQNVLKEAKNKRIEAEGEDTLGDRWGEGGVWCGGRSSQLKEPYRTYLQTLERNNMEEQMRNELERGTGNGIRTYSRGLTEKLQLVLRPNYRYEDGRFVRRPFGGTEDMSVKRGKASKKETYQQHMYRTFGDFAPNPIGDVNLMSFIRMQNSTIRALADQNDFFKQRVLEASKKADQASKRGLGYSAAAAQSAKQKYQFWLTKQADYQKNVDVVESVEAELADEQPWGSAAKQAFDVIDEALAKNPATYLKEREESQGPAAGEADGEQSNAAADAAAVGDRQKPELGLGNAPSLNGDGGGGFEASGPGVSPTLDPVDLDDWDAIGDLFQTYLESPNSNVGSEPISEQNEPPSLENKPPSLENILAEQNEILRKAASEPKKNVLPLHDRILNSDFERAPKRGRIDGSGLSDLDSMGTASDFGSSADLFWDSTSCSSWSDHEDSDECNSLVEDLRNSGF